LRFADEAYFVAGLYSRCDEAFCDRDDLTLKLLSGDVLPVVTLGKRKQHSFRRFGYSLAQQLRGIVFWSSGNDGGSLYFMHGGSLGANVFSLYPQNSSLN
jgi:hypothetical protein